MPPLTPQTFITTYLPLILSMAAIAAAGWQAIFARRQAIAAVQTVILQQRQAELEGRLRGVTLHYERGLLVAEIMSGSTSVRVKSLSLTFRFRNPDSWELRPFFYP